MTVNSALRTVALPGGDSVVISAKPESWWTVQNASGYVDPANIAPDADNPRRVMSPARQKELNESIKACGVRQQIIVTPRSAAPWAHPEPGFEGCFFLAVSGHRRRNGALMGGVSAVPIKVVVYANEKDHRLDMSLLNRGQDDLTPLEEGYEIAQLQRLGWTIVDLCRAFGFEGPQLYGRMHLTRLSPKLQALLDPELPREKRLAVTVGGALGNVKTPTSDELDDVFESFSDSFGDLISREVIVGKKQHAALTDDQRRFALQEALFAVIKARSLSSPQAIELIRDRVLKLDAAKRGNTGRKPQRFQPQRRKAIIESLIRDIMGSMVADWPPSEFRRIFELSTREEIEEYLRRVTEASQMLSGIVGQLEKLRDSKKPTSAVVQSLMKGRTNGSARS